MSQSEGHMDAAYPQTPNRNYRVRARAKTGTTWTPDSAWRGFRYGN